MQPPGMQPPGGQPPVPVPPPPRRPVWRMIVVAVVLVALGAVTTWQALRIDRLEDRLADAQGASAADRNAAKAAADLLAGRVSSLEKDNFKADKIAAAALPSVFRVTAGRFSGTAFVVGKANAGGGSNLFTNFHVVQSVWDGGGRTVAIAHRDLRFSAKIVQVDKEKDLAVLESTEKFPSLATATSQASPGENIVVVGAPLGLESSVTTGVVSAVRDVASLGGKTVQFDAPINPGNSGGPVINAQLQVVGIASAKLRDAEGIGLAIPIDVACTRFPICS
ncbi:S1-C subfamily serine protease [Allocatelliglobosispora scoriae]|uniref:S1-C subfamily serine protease n=1 Tax=Allocatelliglobosispora scoriae TaxID=643052 RepID=A0A841BY77_9ACTN|nr:trypsin-like peptidase domain-containing protein [Allocatelliglobosispora scoriae]MBB5872428.1 S1-C subfamily serine protease [Allocatelliglobosispora scoriae]